MHVICKFVCFKFFVFLLVVGVGWSTNRSKLKLNFARLNLRTVRKRKTPRKPVVDLPVDIPYWRVSMNRYLVGKPT